MLPLTAKIKGIGTFLMRTDGSLGRKILRSGIWVGASKVGLNLLSFIRSIFLARILTPEIFGLMSICMIAIRGLELFTQTGFSAALIHRQKSFEEAKDTAFTLMILRGFVLALVTFLIAPLVAVYYEREVLDLILKILAVTFIFNGFYNINAIGLEKELDFKRLTYLEQIGNFLNFVIVVILAYFLRNVWALVIGHVVSSFIGVVLSFALIPGRPRCRFDRHIAKELFGYGKFITGLTIVLFITTEIDNLLVGKILGMNLLGYYVIAYTLANLPATHVSKVISKVMFPAYSRLQNDLPALRETYLRILKLVSKIAIPAAFGIAILAPEIVGILYGEKWMPAVGPLQILCFFGGFRAIGALNGYVYNAIGRPDIPFYMNTAKLMVIIAIIYPLTVRFGLTGTAIAVTLPLVVQFFVAIYIFTRVLALKVMNVNKVLLISAVQSLTMAAVIIICKRIFSIDDIFALISLVVLGIFIYALLNLREVSNLLRRRIVLSDT